MQDLAASLPVKQEVQGTALELKSKGGRTVSFANFPTRISRQESYPALCTTAQALSANAVFMRF